MPSPKDTQATTKPPSASAATDSAKPTCSLPASKVLTWNSAPTGLPSASKRWPKTPKLLTSWPSDIQITTKPPSASAATEGRIWLLGVKVLTWNSAPTGLPSASKRWPKTPPPLSSWPMKDCQVTTKPPSASAATEGVSSEVASKVLTWNSAPTGLPSAPKRWPKTPALLSSWPTDVQVTTKPSSASAATEGDRWLPTVKVFTWNSSPASRLGSCTVTSPIESAGTTSTMVPVPVASVMVAFTGSLKVTRKVSLPSATPAPKNGTSPKTVTSMVAVVSPGAKVSVPEVEP